MSYSKRYPLEKLRTHTMRYWCLAIVILLLIIIPNTDDVSYYLPALSFVANGHLGVPVGQAGYEYVFLQYADYSFYRSWILFSDVSFAYPVKFFHLSNPDGFIFMACLAVSMPVLKLTDSFVATRHIFHQRY